MLDLNTWRLVVFQINIHCDTCTEASGVLVDRIFRGNFVTNLHYGDLGVQVSLYGSFEVHLA